MTCRWMDYDRNWQLRHWHHGGIDETGIVVVIGKGHVAEGMLNRTSNRGTEVDSKEVVEFGCGSRLCSVLLECQNHLFGLRWWLVCFMRTLQIC